CPRRVPARSCAVCCVWLLRTKPSLKTYLRSRTPQSSTSSPSHIDSWRRPALAAGQVGSHKGSGPLIAALNPGLHAVVHRPFAPLGRQPDDLLCWVLDVAGLAVHTGLRIDLQAVIAVIILDDLVHTGRAVACFGAAVLRQVYLHRH